MSKRKIAILVVAGAIVVFLIGFLPQWLRARSLATELEETRWELTLARLEGRLGAALAEAQRSNYERARQLTASFYTDLQANLERVEDPADRQVLEEILSERDDLITLLSRAEPEATQRLMIAYTRYFAAIDPEGEAAPTSVTPTPPAPAS